MGSSPGSVQSPTAPRCTAVESAGLWKRSQTSAPLGVYTLIGMEEPPSKPYVSTPIISASYSREATPCRCRCAIELLIESCTPWPALSARIEGPTNALLSIRDTSNCHRCRPGQVPSTLPVRVRVNRRAHAHSVRNFLRIPPGFVTLGRLFLLCHKKENIPDDIDGAEGFLSAWFSLPVPTVLE